MENAANTAVGAVAPALTGTVAREGARSEGRLFLLIGAWSGIVGALLSFVANGLHPHPSNFQLELLLREIGHSPTWGALHLMLIIGLVLILVALVAIASSIECGPGAALARVACVVTLLGGALILVSTAIDGFAMNQLGRAWLDAPPAERAMALRTADAFELAGYAIYSLSVVLFLGLGIFLYGLAIVLSSAYPKWLGWLALLSGGGALAVGVVQALAGPSYRATEIFFVLFSVLSTVWVLIMSVVLRRLARHMEPQTSSDLLGR